MKGLYSDLKIVLIHINLSVKNDTSIIINTRLNNITSILYFCKSIFKNLYT